MSIKLYQRRQKKFLKYSQSLRTLVFRSFLSIKTSHSSVKTCQTLLKPIDCGLV